jgi:hypothetical protein
MSIVAVTAVLIVGVVVYFLSRGGSGLDLGGPFPFIAIIAIIAFVALLLRLMAFSLRGDPWVAVTGTMAPPEGLAHSQSIAGP